jgi:hypothetical protein
MTTLRELRGDATTFAWAELRDGGDPTGQGGNFSVGPTMLL